MDEESFKRFYPEEWAKQQTVSGPADTSTQIVNPRDVLMERFVERTIEANRIEEREKLKEEYKGLSNLKKDMVNRKIRKKQRRQQREAKRNA